MALLLALAYAPQVLVTTPSAGEVVMEGGDRILRIRACADEEVRQRADWRAEVEEYLAFASSIFASTFGIRFQVVEIVPWESDNAGQGLGDMLDELGADIPLDGVDVIIGFSAQEPRRGKLSKYVALPWGLTPSLGRVSMVRTMMDDERYDVHLALVHETAHLFGAFHVRQQDSVMRETLQGPHTFQFDAANAKAIRLLKGYDFEAGVERIPQATATRLTQLWRHDGIRTDGNPLSEALYNRGIELHDAGRMDDALALWTRAIEQDEGFAEAHGSIGMALADQGKYEEALQNLHRADDLGWPEAKQALRRVEYERERQGVGDKGEGTGNGRRSYMRQALRVCRPRRGPSGPATCFAGERPVSPRSWEMSHVGCATSGAGG